MSIEQFFEDVTGSNIARHIVSAVGHEKTGKTHFALSMPPPIAYLNLDAGIHRVDLRRWFPHLLKSGMLRQIRLTRDRYPDWGERRLAFEEALPWAASEFRSVIVDTDTEAYRVCRMAEFGRLTQVPTHLYPAVSQRYKDVLDQAKAGGANIVFCSRVKKEYRPDEVVNSKGETSTVNEWTGGYERDGFNEMGYICDTFIETVRNEATEDNEETRGFGIEIGTCGPNPDVDGMLLEGVMGSLILPSFAGLAVTVWPETEPGDWR